MHAVFGTCICYIWFELSACEVLPGPAGHFRPVQSTNMSSCYRSTRSNRLGLSHWDLYTVCSSDVNKDWTHKDKDQTLKDQDKDKDQTYKDKEQGQGLDLQ